MKRFEQFEDSEFIHDLVRSIMNECVIKGRDHAFKQINNTKEFIVKDSLMNIGRYRLGDKFQIILEVFISWTLKKLLSSCQNEEEINEIQRVRSTISNVICSVRESKINILEYYNFYPQTWKLSKSKYQEKKSKQLKKMNEKKEIYSQQKDNAKDHE